MAETIKILHNQEVICEEGCKFFDEGNSKSLTRFSSAYLRWLSARKDGGNFYSKSQEAAVGYIERIANDKDAIKLRALAWLKVILYINPTESKFENKDKESIAYIKKMLKAGADIHYCETDNPIRLAIHGNKLLLSWSSSDNDKNTILSENTVDRGMLYKGVSNDPLIDYYTNYFTRQFDKGKKLKLNQKHHFKYISKLIYCKLFKKSGIAELKDGIIEFEDSWIKRTMSTFKDKKFDTISLITTIVSIIISVIAIIITVIAL